MLPYCIILPLRNDFRFLGSVRFGFQKSLRLWGYSTYLRLTHTNKHTPVSGPSINSLSPPIDTIHYHIVSYTIIDAIIHTFTFLLNLHQRTLLLIVHIKRKITDCHEHIVLAHWVRESDSSVISSIWLIVENICIRNPTSPSVK